MQDKIAKNLRFSKYITIIANSIAAGLFYFAYSINGETWFLIASIALAVAAVGSFFFFNFVQTKLININK